MIVKNFWNQVHLYCGCHEEEIEMIPNTKGSSLFYSCPKYYEEHRDANEYACPNHIKIDHYQKAVEHLANKVAENELDNVAYDFGGYTWKDKNIAYTVKKFTEGDIRISMVNQTAVK